MYDLNGKVAIISGGASCMGRAAAHVEIGFGHGRSFGGLGDVRFSESTRVLGEVLEQQGRHPLLPSTRASFASLIPVSVRHERRSSGVITDRRSASDVERDRMRRGWRGTALVPTPRRAMTGEAPLPSARGRSSFNSMAVLRLSAPRTPAPTASSARPSDWFTQGPRVWVNDPSPPRCLRRQRRTEHPAREPWGSIRPGYRAVSAGGGKG